MYLRGDKVYLHKQRVVGTIEDIYVTNTDILYHIKYNEKVVGEALKADHDVVTHDQVSSLKEVQDVISKVKWNSPSH